VTDDLDMRVLVPRSCTVWG